MMRVSIPWCKNDGYTQANVDDFLSAVRAEFAKYDCTHWIQVHSVYTGSLCEPVLFELDCLDIDIDKACTLTISYTYEGVGVFSWSIENIQNFVQLSDKKSYEFASRGAYGMYLQIDFLTLEEARKHFEEYMASKRRLEKKIEQMETDFGTYDRLNG